MFFFCSFAIAQDYQLVLEHGKSSKKIKIREGQTIRLGEVSFLQDDTLKIKIMEGKLCGANNEELGICVTSVKSKLRSKGKLVEEKEETYKVSYQEKTMKWEDVSFIAKEKSVVLKGMHGLSIAGASLFLAVVNPLISSDFSTNEVSGDKWLRAHLISIAVIAEASIALSLLRYRNLYLKDNSEGKKVWKFKSASQM